MSVDSHVVSLATLFDPERAGDFEATFPSCGWARTPSARVIAGGRIDAGHGLPSADAVLRPGSR